VVACDDPSVTSLPVAQPIAVRNVNERTGITLDVGDFSVYPTLSLSHATDAGPYPTRVRLTGVSIMDPDRGADPVLVRITCRSGSLGLDATAAPLADFISSRYCQTTCLRRTAKLLAFVASPAALEAILGGLTYATSLPKTEDTVDITIHDGVGGTCLAPGAVPTESDTSFGCFVSAAQFRVTSRSFAVVEQLQDKSKERGKSALPYILAGIATGILATILLCVYMCCCRGAAAAGRLCCPVHPAGGHDASSPATPPPPPATPVSPQGLGDTMTRPLVG
jgi:hypothetical protein